MINGPLVVIVGETASGKSSLAIRCGLNINGEIVAADSRTVYKGMDIGTAKPNKDDQAKIAHHGIDLVYPDEDYNVVQFKVYAQQVIRDIQKRGAIPILVGGTGLYVDAVLYDFTFNEGVSNYNRSILNNKSIDELQDIAQENSFINSGEVYKNKRHLIRLIERGGVFRDKRMIPDATVVVGITRPRSELRESIQNRVETMFRQGLRKEHAALVQKYGEGHEALKSIGYRELTEGLKRGESVSKIKRDVVQNTIKYAKRQRTWFKKNTDITWFDNDDSALNYIEQMIGDATKYKIHPTGRVK